MLGDRARLFRDRSNSERLSNDAERLRVDGEGPARGQAFRTEGVWGDAWFCCTALGDICRDFITIFVVGIWCQLNSVKEVRSAVYCRLVEDS